MHERATGLKYDGDNSIRADCIRPGIAHVQSQVVELLAQTHKYSLHESDDASKKNKVVLRLLGTIVRDAFLQGRDLCEECYARVSNLVDPSRAFSPKEVKSFMAWFTKHVNPMVKEKELVEFLADTLEHVRNAQFGCGAAARNGGGGGAVPTPPQAVVLAPEHAEYHVARQRLSSSMTLSPAAVQAALLVTSGNEAAALDVLLGSGAAPATPAVSSAGPVADAEEAELKQQLEDARLRRAARELAEATEEASRDAVR